MASALEALERLRAGNRRFVAGAHSIDELMSEGRRNALVSGQRPIAAILGCSDSRVPVEVVFDQGFGDLFVIRVAGNIVAPSQVGSVEFAAERLGTRLVVVLGHTRCGAVQATLEDLRQSQNQSWNMSSIVSRIRPSVEGLLATDLEHDTERLNAVWQSSAAERLWTAPFVRPVPQPANSRFGTRSIFNGEARNPHGGADFPSPRGTTVRAPNAGRIALAESLYFSGNTVIVDHGLGLFSLLAHLSTMAVHEGDRVAAGQIIGRVGATGRVTGPHLHWAVRANGARVDPMALIALLGRR